MSSYTLSSMLPPQNVTMKNRIKLIKSVCQSDTNNTRKIMNPITRNRNAKSLKRKSASIIKPITMDESRYNERFVEVLSELSDIMIRKGEQFRARAYKSAADAIMQYPYDISEPSQIADLKHVGKTIIAKLGEFHQTGTLQILERERNNPLNQLTRVYGIGPKKAQELVEQGVTSVDDLRCKQDMLTDNMKLGLKYFDDIEARIPRKEIDMYNRKLTEVFKSCALEKSTFEIVGSYRRGNKSSGDIDIIITNRGDNNDNQAFDAFLDALCAKDIIIEMLSRGKTKSMTIARINSKSRARRLDFLYAPPDEYAFALLYFTGSKTFNTIQRQRALDMGYSLNEHGLYKLKDNRKKGTKLSVAFPTEQSIFEFLEMEYREPNERTDARSVKALAQQADHAQQADQAQQANAHDLISTFQKNGASCLSNLSEHELSQMIRDANQAYYGNETPMMSDAEYDILREITETRFPENQVAKEGHTNTKIEITKNKTKLPYEMWSMDKIKPDTQALNKWKRVYKGPYVLSCKLDGVSGLYTSKTKGKQAKLYTRGNGIIGQDVSHLIPYLKLPQTAGVVIRGEFIVSKDVFASKYAKKFANARNFVAGLVNQKKVDPNTLRDLDFVCYEVIKPELKPSEQMTKLETMDNAIAVRHNNPIETLSNEHLSDTLKQWRDDYKYEIDGIICVDDKIYPRVKGNPAHAFAFKMMLSDQIADAKVLDVLWTPSKDGYLKPRVHIEPVVLSGARIEYATGFNGKFINDHRIGMGAVVRIVRSGDVIPHIMEVIEPANKASMPDTNYVWNPTGVDIVLQNTDSDSVVQEKNIAGFFKIIGVEGLSTGNTRRIMEAGFDTVPKIIKMSKDDFLKVDGFKERLATKISEGIKTRLDSVSLAELMQATNIFGRGFGVKRFQAILSINPQILFGDFELAPDELSSKLQSIPGMASKTANQFASHLPAFKTWLKEAGLESKLNSLNTDNTNNTDKKHPLYGKKYVLTGFRDKKLMEKLNSMGASHTATVSKKTDFVIVKSLEESTSKAEEARKLDIKLMTPSQVITLYNI